MTSKGELLAGLVGTLCLLLATAWYQGPYSPAAAAPAPLAGTVLGDAPTQAAGATTLVAAPMYGTVHAAPAPERAADPGL